MALQAQLHELEKQSEERRDVNTLLDKHKKLTELVNEETRANNALNLRIAELEQQAKDCRSGEGRRTDANSENVRSELRRLEHEITVRSEEIRAHQKRKITLTQQLAQSNAQLAELRRTSKPRPILKIAAGRSGLVERMAIALLKKAAGLDISPRFSLSPKQSGDSPRFSQNSPGKSGVTPSSSSSKRKRQKDSEEESKRMKIIQDVEKTLSSGNAATLPAALKTVGRPGQGLASKLLELNRAQMAKTS